jgi:hypothetical protein
MGRAKNNIAIAALNSRRGAITDGFSVLKPAQVERTTTRTWLPSAKKRPENTAPGINRLNQLWTENAFTIIGTIKNLVNEALKLEDLSSEARKEITDRYLEDAMSGDNAHLIATSKQYLEDYLYFTPEDHVKPRRTFNFEELYGANAMDIIATVRKALKEVLPKEDFKAISDLYMQEAMSGDYENVIETSRRYLYEYASLETAVPDPHIGRCASCNGILENENSRYCHVCA